MEQPYGFAVDDRVCMLKKGIHGLKEASRQWNKKIVEFLLQHNFKQSFSDNCVFMYADERFVLYLALYVDDGLLCGNNKQLLFDMLEKLHNEFNITYKEAKFFVGMQIEREREQRKQKIYQSAYIERILNRFNFTNCSCFFSSCTWIGFLQK